MPIPQDVECRQASDGQTHYALGQVLQRPCSLNNEGGLLCNDNDQSSGTCKDYEVRFLCPGGERFLSTHFDRVLLMSLGITLHLPLSTQVKWVSRGISCMLECLIMEPWPKCNNNRCFVSLEELHIISMTIIIVIIIMTIIVVFIVVFNTTPPRKITESESFFRTPQPSLFLSHMVHPQIYCMYVCVLNVVAMSVQEHCDGDVNV